MEFNPGNTVVKRCLEGMAMEEQGRPDEAGRLFMQAWNEATADFEKFIAAHYVARHQPDTTGQLEWLQTALQFALKINDDSVSSALASLYKKIATCYENLGDAGNAKKHHQLAGIYAGKKPSDNGPFYHGTKADLQVGDFLTAGRQSNYQEELTMNHIYFTALVNGAGLAAALARGEGRERVYIVEPTGDFENDPNVTDKKFPGNPTRSYRTSAPLKITGEVSNWQKQTPQELERFRQKLADNKGDIIN